MAGSNSTNQVPTSSSNQQSATPGSTGALQTPGAPTYNPVAAQANAALTEQTQGGGPFSARQVVIPPYSPDTSLLNSAGQFTGFNNSPAPAPTTPSYQYGGDTINPNAPPSSGVSYTGPELTMDGGPTPQITLPANPFSQGPGMMMDGPTPQTPPPSNPFSNPLLNPFSDAPGTYNGITLPTGAGWSQGTQAGPTLGQGGINLPTASGDFTNAVAGQPGQFTNAQGSASVASGHAAQQAFKLWDYARDHGYVSNGQPASAQYAAGLLTPYAPGYLQQGT